MKSAIPQIPSDGHRDPLHKCKCTTAVYRDCGLAITSPIMAAGECGLYALRSDLQATKAVEKP